jgi:hypothetical protein
MLIGVKSLRTFMTPIGVLGRFLQEPSESLTRPAEMQIETYGVRQIYIMLFYSALNLLAQLIVSDMFVLGCLAASCFSRLMLASYLKNADVDRGVIMKDLVQCVRRRTCCSCSRQSAMQSLYWLLLHALKIEQLKVSGCSF